MTDHGKPYGGMGVRDARLRVDPYDNIIVGAQNICRYLGIGSMATMWRWIELYGLPAIKRPDGIWMTSMTAIDQWIFIAAELVNEETQTSRGSNASAHIQLERLQRQLEKPGGFAHKRRMAAIRAARGVGLVAGRVEPANPYLSSPPERELRAHNAASVARESSEHENTAEQASDEASHHAER